MRLFRDPDHWRTLIPRRDRDRRNQPSPGVTFAILRALVILMFGILIVQLVNMQVIKHDKYEARAEINALREVSLMPTRGLIYDRNMQPLVQNTVRFSAAIVPGDLPDRGEAAVYRILSDVIGMPVEEIEKKVEDGIEQQGYYSPAVIKEVDRDMALVLMELQPHAPGLQVVQQATRTYTHGKLLSHVLGYVGPLSAEEYAELRDEGYLYRDQIGKSGVELTYEEMLRGTSGKKLVEVDAAGRELRNISEQRAIDGSNLVLSIDLDLQKVLADVLQAYSGESLNAAAAMMDLRTGEILGMVSLPTYDNNIFSGPISDETLQELINSPGKPLVNHNLSEQYPPGSSFKPIVGAAALQEGVATPYTTYVSQGYIMVQNEFNPNVVTPFRDWAALGTLDFYRGLAMSSNVYFYYLAGGKPDEGVVGLGEERVAAYARAFGLGEPTGIDLLGESEGLVPDAGWKEEAIGEVWTLGDTYNFGIGQGYVAATPMQMLTVASAIANGGQLLTPHVVKEIRDAHGNVVTTVEPEVRRTVPVDEQYLQVVRDAMRQSVTDGVAKTAAVPGVAVAGKTGTAEFGEEQADGKYKTHGWFIGFAPYDDPQVAIVVFVQRGSGGADAAPIASKILDYYFNGTVPAALSEESQ